MPFQNLGAYLTHLREKNERPNGRRIPLARVVSPEFLPFVDAARIMPVESCFGVAEFLEPVSYWLNTDTKGGRCDNSECNGGEVTEGSCASGCARGNCVKHARSPVPFQDRRWIMIRCGSRHDQAGFGVTLNPSGTEDIHSDPNSAGVLLADQSYNCGSVEGPIDLTNEIRNAKPRQKLNPGGIILAIAVDYAKNQLLVEWPERVPFSLDLPSHFRGNLLFPIVQACNGCNLELWTQEQQDEAVRQSQNGQGPQRSREEEREFRERRRRLVEDQRDWRRRRLLPPQPQQQEEEEEEVQGLEVHHRHREEERRPRQRRRQDEGKGDYYQQIADFRRRALM